CSGRDLTMAEVEVFENALSVHPIPTVEALEAAGSSERRGPAGLDLSREGPPNVLFVIIDTLRADHLGCYGYTRDTSPHIDALCERAVVFEQARATGPQTRFSVPAMTTGKHFTRIKRTAGKWPKVDADEKVLAEHFEEAGYFTAAFHSIFYFRDIYGMAQGFDHHDASVVSERHPVQDTPTSDLVTDKVLAFLDSDAFTQNTDPWMLWTY